MSETNRERAFRWMERVWNQREFEVVDELLAPEAIGHHEGSETTGPESFRLYLSNFLEAFPDIQLFVEHGIEEGDHVVVRWTAQGTHQGGTLGIPVTGAEVSFSGMTWFVFNEYGQIVESWDSWNQGALVHQLAQAALLV